MKNPAQRLAKLRSTAGVPSTTEDALLESIGLRLKQQRKRKPVVDIGDDCAVVPAEDTGYDWLLTTDMTVEAVHFTVETHPARAVGWRALARGLSDIAAMGGKPLYCLVSISLGANTGERWLYQFYEGLIELAQRFQVEVVGGDLGHAQCFFCDVVLVGRVPRSQALRRSGARPGDRLFVSGLLGGSACGLRTKRGAAWQKHLRPQPRIELGQYLRAKLKATACIDVSDGFLLDLHRLCRLSGVAARIDQDLPIFPGATEEEGLAGGDDYELIFTVPAGQPVPRSYRQVSLHEVGCIIEGKPGEVIYKGQVQSPRGYDHLALRVGRKR